MAALGFGASLVVSILWLAGWLALAVTAAMMAEDRGQPPALWFVLGLCFPVLALLVLAVGFDREAGHGPTGDGASQLTVADAARRNAVARALGERPASSPEQLQRATSRASRAVHDDLRTLRGLGLADRDTSGRWSLTDAGIAAVRGDEPAGATES